MKIGSSQIYLQAAHQETSLFQSEEKMRYWKDTKGEDTLISPLRPEKGLQTQLTKQKRDEKMEDTKKSSALENVQPNDEEDLSDPHLSLVKQLLESLLGKKINLQQIQLAQKNQSTTTDTLQSTPESASQQPQRVGWGVSYDYAASYHETEQTQFHLSGTIQTQDQQSIQFDLQLNMQREYSTQIEEHLRFGDAKLTDPLVLNFNGTAAELDPTQRFSFDLNHDGQNESLAQLASGNGFLVLDRNKNGKIDDGTELFGPQTGIGIQELAAYDVDHNNWIDENDPIYEWLQVWAPQEAADSLKSLKEVNIGALYLDQIGTPFSLKDTKNQTLGQIKSSGLFVSETGQAGIMQQVDLAT